MEYSGCIAPRPNDTALYSTATVPQPCPRLPVRSAATAPICGRAHCGVLPNEVRQYSEVAVCPPARPVFWVNSRKLWVVPIRKTAEKRPTRGFKPENGTTPVRDLRTAARGRGGSAARPLRSDRNRVVSTRRLLAYSSSRSRSNWFTEPGSALPPVFCITCPTRKLSAPPSPAW